MFKIICIITTLPSTFTPQKILTNASTVLPKYHKERQYYPYALLQPTKASSTLQEASALPLSPNLLQELRKCQPTEEFPSTFIADSTAALTHFAGQLNDGIKTTFMIASRLTL